MFRLVFLAVICIYVHNVLGAIKFREIYSELHEYSDDEFVKEKPSHVVSNAL